MAAKRGRGTANEWTAAEEDLIRSMRESGAKVKDIAEAIGRTENAVRLRINKMNAGDKYEAELKELLPKEPALSLMNTGSAIWWMESWNDQQGCMKKTNVEQS